MGSPLPIQSLWKHRSRQSPSEDELARLAISPPDPFENAIQQIVHEGTNYRMVIPMLLGTAAFGFAEELGASSRLFGALRFPGSRVLPTIAALGADAGVFTLASRQLRVWSGDDVKVGIGAEWLRNSLALGIVFLSCGAGATLARRWRGRFAPHSEFFPSRPRSMFEPQFAEATPALPRLKPHRTPGSETRSYAISLEPGSFRAPLPKPIDPAEIRVHLDVTLEDLAHHVEQGSKSHARELILRAAQDPEAAELLRTAIARYSAMRHKS